MWSRLGRGHRRRRDRPRHHGDGRAPGRGDGPAAVRRRRCARHPSRRRRRGPRYRRFGNSLGLPNIGGETVFDASYAGNPLVNALCVGVLRKEDLHLAFASGTGNNIILFGARTGLDGIGGVSVLASETFGETGRRPAQKLPSVQVGDPFMEKVLIECCLELYAAGLVIGIQDLGGAGLSCATSNSPRRVTAAWPWSWKKSRCGRQHVARGDTVQRVAGTHVRRRVTGER